jgi:hypothetical protein
VLVVLFLMLNACVISTAVREHGWIISEETLGFWYSNHHMVFLLFTSA